MENLRSIYQRIYELLDLYSINAKLGKERIGVSTITIPIYPDIRKAKILSNLETELSLYLGCNVSLVRGPGRYDIIIPRFEKKELKLSKLLSRLQRIDKAIYNDPLTLVLGVNHRNQLIVIKIGTPQIPHLAILGSSGSGKTESLRSILYQLNDMSKVIYTPKTDLDAFRRSEQLLYGDIAKEISDFETILSDLVATMNLRAKTRKHKSPILLIIDELTSLLARSDKATFLLERLSERGRSENIILILATQSGKKTVFGNSDVLRENITTRLCFRTMNKRESTTISGNSDIDCSNLEVGEAILVGSSRSQTISTPLCDQLGDGDRTYENILYSPLQVVKGGLDQSGQKNAKDIDELGDIRKFENLPEKIKKYLLSDRGKEQGISKSILVKELDQSQPRSLEILRELDQLEILGDKKAPNLPSPINSDRLGELVRGVDRLSAGYPQELTSEKAGIS